MPINDATIIVGYKSNDADLRGIEQRLKEISRSAHIDLKVDSRPLGKINADLHAFDQSLAAANARVLAFGASTAAIYGVGRAFTEITRTFVDVEAKFKSIQVILNATTSSFDRFKTSIYNISKDTGKGFSEVTEAANELVRQGLGINETLKRTSDALILSRQSGLGAAESVKALTSALNTFNKEALTSTEVINKLSNVDAGFAVSQKDLIEAIGRSGAAAQSAGVDFDKLLALTTSLQQTTARGGAVIGNALKSIFTRVERSSTLEALQGFNIQTKDLQNNVLSADRILQNLANTYKTLSTNEKTLITERVAGIQQINQLKSLLADLAQANSIYNQSLNTSRSSTNEAIERNKLLNQTLLASLNATKTRAIQFSEVVGKLTFSPVVKKGVGLADKLFDSFSNTDQESKGVGQKIGEGILSGIGSALSGPGLVLGTSVIINTLKGLFTFTKSVISDYSSLNSKTKEQANIQNAINQILNDGNSVYARRLAQARTVREEEEAIKNIMANQNAIRLQQSSRNYSAISSIVQSKGGLRREGDFVLPKNTKTAAGGILPQYNPIIKESYDIERGVGGASRAAQPKVIPNFNFGGGQRGTVVANTDEYIVPNFGGGDGSAIFNPKMVRQYGLPAGAQKINAASGLIPNFAPNHILKYLKSIDPTYVESFKKLRKSDPQLAKFLRKSIDQKNPEAMREYSQFMGGQTIQITPRDYGLKTTYYSNLNDSPENIRNKTREVFTKFEKESPLAGGYIPNYADNLLTDHESFTTLEKLLGRVMGFNLVPTSLEENGKKFKITDEELKKLKLKGRTFDVTGNFGKSVENGETFDPLFSPKSVGNLLTRPREFNIDKYKETKIATGLQESHKITDLFKAAGITPSADPILLKQQIQDLASSKFGKSNFIYKGVNGLQGNQVYPPEMFDLNAAAHYKDLFIQRGIEPTRGNLADQFYNEFRVDVVGGRKGVFGSIPLLKQKVEYLGGKTMSGKPTFRSKFNQHIEKYNLDFLKNPIQAFRALKNAYSSINSIDPAKRAGVSFGVDAFPDGTIELNPSNRTGISGSGGSNLFSSLLTARGLRKASKENVNYFTGVGKEILGLSGVDQENQFKKFNRELLDLRKSDQYGYLKVAKNLNNLGFGITVGKGRAKQQIGGVEAAGLFKRLGLADGYIPNYANPLESAISREYSAGIPLSQIKVENHPSLVSSGNPGGLAVTNQRDEPGGVTQGISRAIKEGRNPKTYGASDGLIPNFARDPRTGRFIKDSQLLDNSIVSNIGFSKKYNNEEESVSGLLTQQEIAIKKSKIAVEKNLLRLAQEQMVVSAKNLLESKEVVKTIEENAKTRVSRLITFNQSQNARNVGLNITRPFDNPSFNYPGISQSSNPVINPQIFSNFSNYVPGKSRTLEEQELRDQQARGIKNKRAADKARNELFTRIDLEQRDKQSATRQGLITNLSQTFEQQRGYYGTPFGVTRRNNKELEKFLKSKEFSSLGSDQQKLAELDARNLAARSNDLARQKKQGYALSATFGLPVITGALTSQLPKDSLGARQISGVVEAGSTGLSIAAIANFSKLGIVGGALVATFSGLKAVAENSRKSLEDYGKELENTKGKFEESRNNVAGIFQGQAAVKDAVESGASNKQINQLSQQILDLLRNLDDPKLRNKVIGAKNEDQQAEILTELNAKSVKNISEKGLSSVLEEVVGKRRNIISDFGVTIGGKKFGGDTQNISLKSSEKNDIVSLITGGLQLKRDKKGEVNESQISTLNSLKKSGNFDLDEIQKKLGTKLNIDEATASKFRQLSESNRKFIAQEVIERQLSIAALGKEIKSIKDFSSSLLNLDRTLSKLQSNTSFKFQIQEINNSGIRNRAISNASQSLSGISEFLTPEARNQQENKINLKQIENERVTALNQVSSSFVGGLEGFKKDIQDYLKGQEPVAGEDGATGQFSSKGNNLAIEAALIQLKTLGNSTNAVDTALSGKENVQEFIKKLSIDERINKDVLRATDQYLQDKLTKPVELINTEIENKKALQENTAKIIQLTNELKDKSSFLGGGGFERIKNFDNTRIGTSLTTEKLFKSNLTDPLKNRIYESRGNSFDDFFKPKKINTQAETERRAAVLENLSGGKLDAYRAGLFKGNNKLIDQTREETAQANAAQIENQLNKLEKLAQKSGNLDFLDQVRKQKSQIPEIAAIQALQQVPIEGDQGLDDKLGLNKLIGPFESLTQNISNLDANFSKGIQGDFTRLTKESNDAATALSNLTKAADLLTKSQEETKKLLSLDKLVKDKETLQKKLESSKTDNVGQELQFQDYLDKKYLPDSKFSKRLPRSALDEIGLGNKGAANRLNLRSDTLGPIDRFGGKTLGLETDSESLFRRRLSSSLGISKNDKRLTNIVDITEDFAESQKESDPSKKQNTTQLLRNLQKVFPDKVPEIIQSIVRSKASNYTSAIVGAGGLNAGGKLLEERLLNIYKEVQLFQEQQSSAEKITEQIQNELNNKGEEINNLNSNNSNGMIPQFSGGLLKSLNKEKRDILRGVGGARPGDGAYITNLAGVGPAVVNTGEKIVRNYKNSGKDAVINRKMMNFSLGLTPEQFELLQSDPRAQEGLAIKNFITKNLTTIGKVTQGLFKSGSTQLGLKSSGALGGAGMIGSISAGFLSTTLAPILGVFKEIASGSTYDELSDNLFFNEKDRESRRKIRSKNGKNFSKGYVPSYATGTNLFGENSLVTALAEEARRGNYEDRYKTRSPMKVLFSKYGIGYKNRQDRSNLTPEEGEAVDFHTGKTESMLRQLKNLAPASNRHITRAQFEKENPFIGETDYEKEAKQFNPFYDSDIFNQDYKNQTDKFKSKFVGSSDYEKRNPLTGSTALRSQGSPFKAVGLQTSGGLRTGSLTGPRRFGSRGLTADEQEAIDRQNQRQDNNNYNRNVSRAGGLLSTKGETQSALNREIEKRESLKANNATRPKIGGNSTNSSSNSKNVKVDHNIKIEISGKIDVENARVKQIVEEEGREFKKRIEARVKSLEDATPNRKAVPPPPAAS